MDTVLSILMLGALAMVAGAIYLWRKGGYRKQVTLMVVLAAIMLANVLIMTIPTGDGTIPADRAAFR